MIAGLHALGAMGNTASITVEVKKEMHEHEGLIVSLVAVIGNKNELWKKVKGRQIALDIIKTITKDVAGSEKGLYEHPGFITSLDELVEEWEGGNGWKEVLYTLDFISEGDDEVKNGLYNQPGLIASMVTVIKKKGSELRILPCDVSDSKPFR